MINEMSLATTRKYPLFGYISSSSDEARVMHVGKGEPIFCHSTAEFGAIFSQAE